MGSEPGSNSLWLRVICLNPPSPTYAGKATVFGLQDKSQAVQAGELQPDGVLEFECVLQVKPGQPPDFLGKYVHGTPGKRFLYLSWGYDENGHLQWIKRIKVPLSGITWAKIEDAKAADSWLEATIDGRGAATVPLLGNGWSLP
jgi:hypothetical protein